jgi:hypothetical protein
VPELDAGVEHAAVVVEKLDVAVQFGPVLGGLFPVLGPELDYFLFGLAEVFAIVSIRTSHHPIDDPPGVEFREERIDPGRD